MTRPNVMVVSTSGGAIALYGLMLGTAICRAAGPGSLVVAPASSRDMWQATEHPTPQDVRIDFLDFDGLRGKVGAWRRVISLMRAHDIEIVHDTSGSVSRASAAFWPLVSFLAKLYLTEHEPFPHAVQKRPMDMMTRRIADSVATGIFVHGSKSAERLLFRGCPRHKIHIARHGAFSIYGRPAIKEPPPPPIVLVFGRMRPNKGYQFLPEIVRLTRRRVPEAQFCVAGSSEIGGSPAKIENWKKQLDAILAELRSIPGVGVHDHYVPDAEVHRYFARAAVVLLPYQTSSESGVLATAAALGVPSVVTDVGDLAETTRENRLGRVASADPRSIAETLADLLENAEERRRIRRSCIAYAAGRGNWELVAAEHLRAYGMQSHG